MTHQLRVGFVGLGFMGHGMAANVLRRGFPLGILAHRKREAIDDLVAKGAKEFTTAAGLAADCDVIFLCVPGSKQVEQLVEGESGMARGAYPGLTIVDCTTSNPATLLRLAETYSAQGLTFVDAPLGRSPREAWKGELSTMVGCAPELLQKIQPVLDCFATTVQHVGPLGNGHRLKLVNNFISLGYAALYSEALTLALKAGLGVEAFDDLVRSSRMNCQFYDTFSGWMLRGDAMSHPFALDTALHTISDVVDFSRAVNLKANLAKSVRELYAAAVADGFSEAMLPELARAVARASDVNLKPLRADASI